ncbi:hypothetical protein C8R45DRAFT_1224857 [Mycena sanguinolenta]|nr:hypothetical protein C8R45DRAFT_1224857 [Mycena sanguinolenta]
MQRLPALRLMPTRVFRPHMSSLHHSPIIRRSLATVAQNTLHAAAVDNDPCAGFYRTKIDIGPFSCHWEHFLFSEFFAVSQEWHDLSEMEFFVKRVMKIGGTIRPLAYLAVQDPCIVFEASGNYYFLDRCTNYVEHFGGHFVSDENFLTALGHTPRIVGKKYWFHNTTNELYAEVCKEQKQRAKAARKLRPR